MLASNQQNYMMERNAGMKWYKACAFNSYIYTSWEQIPVIAIIFFIEWQQRIQGYIGDILLWFIYLFIFMAL